MAVPRTRRAAGAAVEAPPATPDVAAVAAGINLAALPGAPAPQAVPPALNLAGATPAAAAGLKLSLAPPAPAAAPPVDLSKVYAELDELKRMVTGLANLISEKSADLSGLINQVGAGVDGLYEPMEEEAPVTPVQVANAKPPKEKKAKAEVDTFSDVPMQEALQGAIGQLNGYDLATAVQSLTGAMATHGHPSVDPNRVAGWLTSLGVVVDGLIAAN